MNTDQNYDRSFLRHDILPRLTARWPTIAAVLARASGYQAQAAELLDELAAIDLRAHTLPDADTLSLQGIHELSPGRRGNLLRYWLRSRGLPVPDSRILEQILSTVLKARPDAQPCIPWHGMEIRRYQQALYLVPRRDCTSTCDNQLWDLTRPFDTPLGRLTALRSTGPGISVDALPQSRLTVRYRRGGETLRPAGRSRHHQLKKLLQERRILPWLRDSIPLLYRDEELVAVAGFWIADPYQAAPNEQAWCIHWEGKDKVMQK